MIGVRLSAFDTPPYPPSQSVAMEPVNPAVPLLPPRVYPGFGCDRNDPFRIDLSETVRLLRLMRDELAIELVNLTAGSPYYNPHIQRPALFPPSDSYPPPEDPLAGCARQIEVVRQLRRDVSGLPIVGSAYTYLQEYLPHVAQAVVREGWVDFVGLGRMLLSYPDLPADVLEQGQLDRHRLCRTFSDCTTAPRAGLVSGCYPLDPFYRDRPEHQQLKARKTRL
jgi:2,4-dienoyl-CoA reductase-like NADH-dependent reductase (Old Yellow Enzyme family)